MLKSLTIPTCLALGLALATSQSDGQVVREGVRRTGEAVVEGGRAIVDGTRNVIDRTGQAARNAVDNTTDAARARVDRQQRSELRPGNVTVDSNLNADSTEFQTETNINANQPSDSSGQNSAAEGAYGSGDGEYQAGYRGLNGQAATTGQVEYEGRVYCLRHDRQGREYICVGGRPVYFDDHEGQQHQAYKLNDEQMLHQEGRNDQYGESQLDQSQAYQGSEQSGTDSPAPPSPPTPVRPEIDSAAPAAPSLNAETNIPAEQQTDLNASSDVDADVRSSVSSDTNADSGIYTEAESSVESHVDSDANDGNDSNN